MPTSCHDQDAYWNFRQSGSASRGVFASRPGLLAALFSLLVLLLSTAQANACNIPVFRYALERWKSDAYQLTVFHQSKLSPAHQLIVDNLVKASTQSDGNANISVELKQVADVKDVDVIVDDQLNPQQPYAVLQTSIRGKVVRCWEGRLDDLVKANLVHSPSRSKLAKRLLRGDSVVWVLVGKKNAPSTQTARELLETSLGELERKVRLPEGIGIPGSELFSEIPLLLQFSAMEVDVDDPQEQYLVELLARLQPDAFEQSEPLIVPVFGRGRALEVIPASGLSDRLIEDLTVFLGGACSCQVKDRNPGFDLLMSVDWEQEVFGDNAPHPPSKSVSDPDSSPRLLTIPPGR